MSTGPEADTMSNELLADLVARLRDAVEAQVCAGASFQEREAAALAIANELTRGYLQNELERIADEHGDRLLIAMRVARFSTSPCVARSRSIASGIVAPGTFGVAAGTCDLAAAPSRWSHSTWLQA